MSAKRIALIVVVLVLVVIVGMWLKNFISEDKCLDSGGRWSATTHTCERGINPPGGPAEKLTAATNSERCVTRGKIIDLAVAGDQARSALAPGGGPELRVDSLIARDEGFIVKLLAAGPTKTIGGGGLVWVNAQTGCAIVLARYE